MKLSWTWISHWASVISALPPSEVSNKCQYLPSFAHLMFKPVEGYCLKWFSIKEPHCQCMHTCVWEKNEKSMWGQGVCNYQFESCIKACQFEACVYMWGVCVCVCMYMHAHMMDVTSYRVLWFKGWRIITSGVSLVTYHETKIWMQVVYGWSRFGCSQEALVGNREISHNKSCVIPCPLRGRHQGRVTCIRISLRESR